MKLTLRIRNKIAKRYGAQLEAMVDRTHARLKKRLRRRFQAALGVDDELLGVDEAQALRDFLERTVKVTYRVGRAQGEAEGWDTETAAGRHTQNQSALASDQMNYSRRLVDDQEAASNKIIREVLEEQGPDVAEMTRRMEDQLGMFQARARAIAVTETAGMYGNAYADTLESNGIYNIIWRRDPGMREKAECDLCDPLDGQVMSIDEFRSQFPAHTNCACYPEAYLGEGQF